MNAPADRELCTGARGNAERSWSSLRAKNGGSTSPSPSFHASPWHAPNDCKQTNYLDCAHHHWNDLSNEL